MIAQLIFGAEGTLRQLGLRMGIISLALAGGCSVLILAPGVSKPGEIGAPEQATASLACLFFAAFTVMFLYTTVWDRWESRFDTMPWSDAKLSGKGESGRRASTRKGPCPFTGTDHSCSFCCRPCLLRPKGSKSLMTDIDGPPPLQLVSSEILTVRRRQTPPLTLV